MQAYTGILRFLWRKLKTDKHNQSQLLVCDRIIVVLSPIRFATIASVIWAHAKRAMPQIWMTQIWMWMKGLVQWPHLKKNLRANPGFVLARVAIWPLYVAFRIAIFK